MRLIPVVIILVSYYASATHHEQTITSSWDQVKKWARDDVCNCMGQYQVQGPPDLLLKFVMALGSDLKYSFY